MTGFTISVCNVFQHSQPPVEGIVSSATVPLSITFAVLSTGEFITPEGYGITNNSVVPIHVSEIKVSDIAEGYEFVANEDDVSGKKIRLQMQPESSKSINRINIF